MNVDIKSMPKPMKAFFNGIAQVVFIENTISGIIFFISFFIAGLEMTQWDFGSWDSWKFGIFTLIGVNLSNLTAYLMGADRDAITSGLFGFCPNLVAIAAGVFAGDAFTAWFVLLAGCILVVPIQIVINRFTGHFGLPGFTFPFIVTTWFFILISFSTDLLTYNRAGVLPDGTLSAGGWMTASDPVTFTAGGAGSGTPELYAGEGWGLFFTNGFEEIWVIDGFIGSLICIFGYFWYDWKFAIRACMAMGFTVGFGLIFSVNMGQMNYALYGYSAILTIGGLDTFASSKPNTGRYWFLFFLGLVLTCFLNYAIGNVLGVFGLPNCTLAFVIAGWMILVVEHFMLEQAEKRALK